ncbi:hypothetical protein [Microbacterium sp.]|uniref:hypothetical protein n=1 Tax=Microbacterium sp. TaxID=51671 RepID=UPI003F9E28AC
MDNRIDIVDDLRDGAWGAGGPSRKRMRDAADEIERLRGEVEELREWIELYGEATAL